MTSALRFIVFGRVQGVNFRAATCVQARECGVSGFVRNLPDGSVEVVAEGRAEALAQLEAWLHHGPPAARVEQVEATAIAVAGLAGFQRR